MAITFACPGCQQQLRVSDDKAGKKAKCPSCATLMMIPDAPAFVEDPMPARTRPQRDAGGSAPRASNQEEPFPDDGDERAFVPKKRRKRKSGSSAVLWIAVGVASLVLLAAVGVGAYFLFFRGSLDSRYLPDDCEMVARIDVSDLTSSSLYKDLKGDYPEQFNKLDEMLASQVDNLKIEDISSVTMGGGKDMVAVIKTKKKISPDNVKQKKDAKESKVGKYTLYELHGDAFCMPDSHTVILGEPETLKKVLERNGNARFSDTLKSAIGKTNFSSTIAMAAVTKPGQAGDLLPGGIGVPHAKDLPQTDYISASINVGSDLDIKVTARCEDSSAAAEAKKKVEELKQQADQLGGAGGQGDAEMLNELKEITKSIKVSQSGSQVTMTATVKGSSIKKLFKGLQGLFGAFGGGAPPDFKPQPPGPNFPGQPFPMNPEFKEPKPGDRPAPVPVNPKPAKPPAPAKG